ncbi:hypothetical protein JCM1393_09710 [Clostridium carnis]
MSKNVRRIDFIKKIVNVKNNSQFIGWNLIEYNKEQYEVEFLELMKKGYEQMAEINLEIANLPFECENADINEYENWLCGV